MEKGSWSSSSSARLKRGGEEPLSERRSRGIGFQQGCLPPVSGISGCDAGGGAGGTAGSVPVCEPEAGLQPPLLHLPAETRGSPQSRCFYSGGAPAPSRTRLPGRGGLSDISGCCTGLYSSLPGFPPAIPAVRHLPLHPATGTPRAARWGAETPALRVGAVRPPTADPCRGSQSTGGLARHPAHR